MALKTRPKCVSSGIDGVAGLAGHAGLAREARNRERGRRHAESGSGQNNDDGHIPHRLPNLLPDILPTSTVTAFIHRLLLRIGTAGKPAIGETTYGACRPSRSRGLDWRALARLSTVRRLYAGTSVRLHVNLRYRLATTVLWSTECATFFR